MRATTISILGPARNLRRVREQAAEVEDVQGVFGFRGPAHTILITLRLPETRRRLHVTLNRAGLGGARRPHDDGQRVLGLPHIVLAVTVIFIWGGVFR